MNPQEVKKPGIVSARQIPTFRFALQNIAISFASVIVSTASLAFTASVVLPLSACRSILPARMLNNAISGERGKVVLIVGASRGIGYNVMKQYVNETSTTVIAVSRTMDSVRKAVDGLGSTSARVECVAIDLMSPKKQIEESIRSLDAKFGPVTHLYQISGISNHLEDESQWGLDVTQDMIDVNVSGTVASALTMYALMKERQYGKMCIVGSVAGLYGPANMISYASTKSFVNTFSSSLRVLAAPSGVEVVTVQPGFIDTRMTKKMRGQENSMPAMEFASAEGMAIRMKDAVEGGGVGLVSWPVRQTAMMYALKSVNPICDELGRWASMKMGMSGKKIT